MKQPEQKAKQRMKSPGPERGLEERERERLQKHNLTPSSSHSTEVSQIHTLGFSFCLPLTFFPKANLNIFCFCFSSHAIKSPAGHLGQGHTLFLTNHYSFYDVVFP